MIDDLISAILEENRIKATSLFQGISRILDVVVCSTLELLAGTDRKEEDALLIENTHQEDGDKEPDEHSNKS
jgi:hypothetical protein